MPGEVWVGGAHLLFAPCTTTAPPHAHGCPSLVDGPPVASAAVEEDTAPGGGVARGRWEAQQRGRTVTHQAMGQQKASLGDTAEGCTSPQNHFFNDTPH